MFCVVAPYWPLQVGLPQVQNSRVTSQRTLFFTPDSYTLDRVWFQSWNRPVAGGAIDIVDDVPSPSRVDGNDTVYATNVATKAVSPCHFPFTYNGRVYTSCACGGLSAQPWCPLSSDPQAGVIGICVADSPVDASCPQKQSAPAAVAPSAVAGIIVGVIIGIVLVALVGYAIRRNGQQQVAHLFVSQLLSSGHLTPHRDVGSPDADRISLSSQRSMPFASKQTKQRTFAAPRWEEFHQ